MTTISMCFCCKDSSFPWIKSRFCWKRRVGNGLVNGPTHNKYKMWLPNSKVINNNGIFHMAEEFYTTLRVSTHCRPGDSIHTWYTLKNKASCANEPCNLQGNKLVLMRRQCALQAGTREIRCLRLVNLAPTGSKALHSNLTKFPFPLSTKNSMILFIVCYTARKTSLYAWIHPILSVTASVIIVMYLQYILHKFISVYNEFHLPTKNLNNNFWIAADLHTQPVQTIGTMEITLSTLAVFLCNPNSAHSH